MKLDHALLDQGVQQLVWTVAGWLFGVFTKALRRRFGASARRASAEPAAQDRADS